MVSKKKEDRTSRYLVIIILLLVAIYIVSSIKNDLAGNIVTTQDTSIESTFQFGLDKVVYTVNSGLSLRYSPSETNLELFNPSTGSVLDSRQKFLLGRYRFGISQSKISFILPELPDDQKCLPVTVSSIERGEQILADVKYGTPDKSENSWLGKLRRDAKKIKDNNKHEYVPDHNPDGSSNPNNYDCDDFAAHMDDELGKLGYQTTFTSIICIDKIMLKTRSHALSDVHSPKKKIVFIDGQSGEFVDLDLDQDGDVEAHDGDFPLSNPLNNQPAELPVSEQNKLEACWIGVYKSRVDAESHNVPIDEGGDIARFTGLN